MTACEIYSSLAWGEVPNIPPLGADLHTVSHLFCLLLKGYIKVYTSIRHPAQNKHMHSISFHLPHHRMTLFKSEFGETEYKSLLSFKASLHCISCPVK